MHASPGPPRCNLSALPRSTVLVSKNTNINLCQARNGRIRFRIPRPRALVLPRALRTIKILSIERRQRKARVLDDIKAFRERRRSAQPRVVPGTQARARNLFGCEGESSRMMSDSSTHQGRFPRRPLSDKIRDRPSTTDGVSPRQQVRKNTPKGLSSLCRCAFFPDNMHGIERPLG